MALFDEIRELLVIQFAVKPEMLGDRKSTVRDWIWRAPLASQDDRKRAAT